VTSAGATVDDSHAATVSDMSRSLSEQLEQRRQHWQRDVERMQRDFFKVQLWAVFMSYVNK